MGADETSMHVFYLWGLNWSLSHHLWVKLHVYEAHLKEWIHKFSLDPNLPENFLWSTRLDLFVRDYSWLEILLGLGIAHSRHGVGLSGSPEQSILTRSHILALRGALERARFFRPANAE